MPTGMTIKQMHRRRFFDLLQLYREALQAKDHRAIVTLSVALHGALGHVPKSYKRMVNAAFRGE